MQALSVVCILTLALYLLIVLAMNQRGNGRVLFRSVYSAVVLGVLSGLFFAVFESTVTAFAAYIPEQENILRPAFAYLMVLIPVNIAILLVGMLLKKKRPMLLLILASAVDLLGSAGVLVYTALCEQMDTNSLSTVLGFLAIYLPYLLGFAANGLLTRATKAENILMELSLYLNLAVSLGFFIVMGITTFPALQAFGLSGFLPLLPFILAWLAIPSIPLLVEQRFKNADAVRNGEAPKKHKLFAKNAK